MDITITHGLVDVVGILPMIVLFLMSLIPIIVKLANKNIEPDPIVTTVLGVAGFLSVLIATVTVYPKTQAAAMLFSKAVRLDGVSVFATGLVCMAGVIVLILSMENLATRGRQYTEYVFLMMNAALGMVVVAWSNDLIVTFIGIEVMSLCLYLIIAMSHEERLSKEAAFKYFVLGGLASAIFLYGVALMFGATGTTYIDEISSIAGDQISQSKIFLFGILLAIIGLCFKVSIAPFHAWTPDVYEGAQTPVTAFMATAVKLVTFVVFMRLVVGDYLTQDLRGRLLDVLQWLAVLTMVVGNIGAIMQEGLKRMLAYSSIAHSGYIMMGLIAAAVGGQSWLGATGVTYYVFAYTIMTLGAFAVVTVLEKHESHNILVDDLAGLSKTRPILSACLAIFMLSLAGIPPMVGFFGKFFLFSAAIKQGFFWMAVWAAINSVISVYYYLRPIVVMYMRPTENPITFGKNYLGAMSIVLMAAATILVGVFTEPVYVFVVNAIRGLY